LIGGRSIEDCAALYYGAKMHPRSSWGITGLDGKEFSSVRVLCLSHDGAKSNYRTTTLGARIAVVKGLASHAVAA